MSPPSIKYNRFIIIGIAAIIVTGIVIITLDRNSILSIAGKVNWMLVSIALATTGGSYFFQCFSYVILNRIFNVNPGFGVLFRVGFASIAIGNIVSIPFGVTEHGIRVLLLVPRGYKGGDVVAASVFHSYIKDVAILVMAPAVLLFQVFIKPLDSDASRYLIIVAVLATILLIIYSLIFLSKVIRGYILRGIAKLWRLITRRDPQRQTGDFDQSIEQTKAKLREHPGTGLILLGFMFGDWIFVLATLELCFMALGMVTPFLPLASGYIVGKTAAVLSFIPGGIGVQTTSTGGIYSLLGIPFNLAILVAILFRVVYQYIPYIGSFPLFRSLLRIASKQNQNHH